MCGGLFQGSCARELGSSGEIARVVGVPSTVMAPWALVQVISSACAERMPVNATTISIENITSANFFTVQLRAQAGRFSLFGQILPTTVEAESAYSIELLVNGRERGFAEACLDLPNLTDQMAHLQTAHLLDTAGLSQLVEPAGLLVRRDSCRATQLTAVCLNIAEDAGIPGVTPRAAYLKAQAQVLTGDLDSALQLVPAAYADIRQAVRSMRRWLPMRA